MRKIIRISLMLLLVLSVSISAVFVGNMAGTNTPEALALTTDEIDLCKLLHTYIDTDNVDPQGFLLCLANFL